MIVSVVSVGNSRGIRIPKAILEQLAIGDSLDLEIEEKRLVLTPVPRQARQGWEEAFRSMSDRGDDRLLIAEDANEYADEGTDAEGFAWEW